MKLLQESMFSYKEITYFELYYYFPCFVHLMLYIHFFFWIRLREHVHGADNNPLLIFPEGTCVNNHYTVMFKKVSLIHMPTAVFKLSLLSDN